MRAVSCLLESRGGMMRIGWIRRLTASVAVLGAPVLGPSALPAPPWGAGVGSARGASPWSQPLVAAVHTTYTRGASPRLANALDTGASLIELDTWTDIFGSHWKVSHDNPF